MLEFPQIPSTTGEAEEGPELLSLLISDQKRIRALRRVLRPLIFITPLIVERTQDGHPVSTQFNSTCRMARETTASDLHSNT